VSSFSIQREALVAKISTSYQIEEVKTAAKGMARKWQF
jgi:hypothetical protein